MNIFKKKYKVGKHEVKLDKIKIKSCFKRTSPNVEKFRKKYRDFKGNPKWFTIKNKIVVLPDLTLIDGYVTYLILKAFGYDIVDVQVVNE